MRIRTLDELKDIDYSIFLCLREIEYSIFFNIVTRERGSIIYKFDPSYYSIIDDVIKLLEESGYDVDYHYPDVTDKKHIIIKPVTQ